MDKSSEKKVQNHDPKEKMLRIAIWHFFSGDLSQSKKLSENKQPLMVCVIISF